jgi:hypothetical protein
MKKIKTYHEFNKLFESTENSDHKVLSALRKWIGVRKINQWIACREFGGVYSPLGYNEETEGGPVLFKWKGEERELPGANFFRNYINDITVSYDHHSSRKDYRKGWDYIDGLIRESQKESKSKGYNIFDDKMEEIPIIKEMMSKGMEIISSPAQRKRGNVVVKFPNSRFNYTITNTGYIRRGIIDIPSARKQLIGGNTDLHKTIETKEDIIPKISYVYIQYLKDLLDVTGVSRSRINSLVKSLTSGDGMEYKEFFDLSVKVTPELAYKLPTPEGRKDDELVKGARVLGRMGIFN